MRGRPRPRCGQRELGLEFDLFCGPPHKDFELAGIGAPLLGGHVEIGKRPTVETYRYSTRLSGAQNHPRKTLQFLRRTRNSGVTLSDIYLCHFSALALSGIDHLKRNRESARRRRRGDGQIAIGKGGVGQTVPERKQRLGSVVLVT